MFTKLITIFICFTTLIGSRVHPKIFYNVKDDIVKMVGDAGFYDHGFDSSDNQDKENEYKQTTCGKPSVEPNTLQRIMGGVEAIPHSWPWQVSVQYKNGDTIKNHCGGTIISATKILTSANCIFDRATAKLRPITNLYVVAGIHNLSDSYSSENSQAKKVIIVAAPRSYDPKYKLSHPNPDNIAILSIDSPGFTFDDKVQPACLPTSPVKDDINCYITGWGNLWAQEENNFKTLYQVSVPIIPNYVCNSWYSGIIKDNVLCAGLPHGNKGPCFGDGGGPLTCNHDGVWVVDGVVNWGRGCGEPRRPAVFTRVYSFLDWINFHG